MIEKRNLYWSATEFICVMFVQFFVMRFIISQLGINALGIWAVLMSTATIAGFLGMGTASGPGRFLAIAHSTDNKSEIEKILSTVMLGTVPIYLILGFFFYFPLFWGLQFVLDGNNLIEGRELLILALGSYVLQMISTAFASSLTNLHKGHLKSKIGITSSILQAILSVTLIKEYGLAGLAIAQISSYIYILLMAVILLKMNIGIRLNHLFRWHTQHFKTIILFGSKMQIASIGWSAFEISIRFLMARFGGLSAVGYYEVAYKIASQARIFIFFIGQNIGPVLAGLWAGDEVKFGEFYRVLYARLSAFAIVMALGLAIISPLTSYIMLGEIQIIFCLFSLMTGLGAAFHIFAMSSELAAVAIGKLRYNIQGTFTAFITLMITGFLFGHYWDAFGVASAVLLSSLLASLTPIYFGHKIFKLNGVPKFRTDLKLKEFIISALKKKSA